MSREKRAKKEIHKTQSQTHASCKKHWISKNKMTCLGILLCLLSATVLSLLCGSSAFLPHHHLKGWFQRDHRDIRPSITLMLMNNQDIELGSIQVMNKTLLIKEQGRAINAHPHPAEFTYNHNTCTNNENCS